MRVTSGKMLCYKLFVFAAKLTIFRDVHLPAAGTSEVR